MSQQQKGETMPPRADEGLAKMCQGETMPKGEGRQLSPKHVRTVLESFGFDAGKEEAEKSITYAGITAGLNWELRHRRRVGVSRQQAARRI